MFGFLRGPRGDADYRRVYARCCRYQRLFGGWRSAALVSYEGAFAYAMLADALRRGPLAESEPLCCRLRGARKLAGADDEPLGRASTAVGMLLLSIKLRDDVRDDRSLLAALALRVLKRPISQAQAFFERIDPAAPGRFDRFVEQHLEIERGTAGRSIDEYSSPTEEGFACVFSLIAATDPRAASHADAFGRVGRLIGRAIIAADCAADWRRDRRRNLPNPVRRQADADAAVERAQRALSEAGWVWSTVADGRSVALRTLRSTITRIETIRRSGEPAAERRTASALPRWARAGDCDCGCDCAGADCGGGDGACCGGGGPDGSAPICIDCSGLCCWCDWPNRSESAVSRKALRGGGSFVGRKGRANGELNPEGLVVINDRNHPARTAGERIAGGTEVIVVEDGEFGLVVERADEEA